MKIYRIIEKASFKIELNQREFHRLKDSLMKAQNYMQSKVDYARNTEVFAQELTEIAKLLSEIDQIERNEL